MVLSTRGILAIGLGVTGLAFLVGPSLGQLQDGTVRKAAGQTAGAMPPAAIAPVIGTIDIDSVFKNYEKFKVASKDFNTAMLARKNELMKLMSEAQEEAQMLQKLRPGTEDFTKHENRVTELKARHEAGREQAQREFALRDAENVATIYKEVQAMVVRIAHWRKMNYVVKISNQPIAGTDPNSVMNAIQNTIVYADPANDITNDVIYNLNRVYTATSGPAPKTTNGAAPASRPANPAQSGGN
ncbi:MAG: OmpH family outer membrane protein [Isosphaerales bacterium]